MRGSPSLLPGGLARVLCTTTVLLEQFRKYDLCGIWHSSCEPGIVHHSTYKLYLSTSRTGLDVKDSIFVFLPRLGDRIR